MLFSPASVTEISTAPTTNAVLTTDAFAAPHPTSADPTLTSLAGKTAVASKNLPRHHHNPLWQKSSPLFQNYLKTFFAIIICSIISPS